MTAFESEEIRGNRGNAGNLVGAAGDGAHNPTSTADLSRPEGLGEREEGAVADQVVVVTLENLAGGAALELFQSELGKVLHNIADPNTDAEAVRKVTLEVSFHPNEEREFGEVRVKATSKIAGLKGARTQVYFGNHKGELVATEFSPKQQKLFDSKPELRQVVGKQKEGA